MTRNVKENFHSATGTNFLKRESFALEILLEKLIILITFISSSSSTSLASHVFPLEKWKTAAKKKISRSHSNVSAHKRFSVVPSMENRENV